MIPLPLFVGIEQFRAHLGGALTLTLVAEPGVSFDIHEADFDLISKAIERHRSMVRTFWCDWLLHQRARGGISAGYSFDVEWTGAFGSATFGMGNP